MKAIAVVLLFGTIVFAQDGPSPGNAAPGCGPASIKFEVKADKSPHALVQTPAGQAMVYFVEDDTEFESNPKPTTRIGVDGTWVGANHGNSYFSFAVAPGVHHLCASWQSRTIIGAHDTSAAAHFTAEAGQVYYFRVKNKWLREHASSHVDLSPVDSDEGQLLASRRVLSVSRPK
ncbi:MAG TPA: DUF2846 domain-containing protein [Candidatus Sulfotelmatobacter sp.]|nr:DUF2846 domain-containing protein [Candidatus Sulfotelmatobacter sp.]